MNLRRFMVRIAAIGLGNRTCKYLQYVKEHAEDVVLVAVVEPERGRRLAVISEFGLAEKFCFDSVDHLWNSDIQLDAVIVGSPDRTHFHISMGCLKRGWHVLLEKPAASTVEECAALIHESQTRGLSLCVCYVLRYHPYYISLKSILEKVDFGKLLSVNHTINVGLDRMTHTFVRGFWSCSDKSSPIIVSKASHDVDLLYWLTDRKFKVIASEGKLNRYKKENAPAGSSTRCVHCGIEKECRFSAVDLYLRRDDWNRSFDIREGETREDSIIREMNEGRFGRCVYCCDNDVVDFQTVEMVTDDGCKVSMTIDGLTSEDSRITRFIFENGEVYADGRIVKVISDGVDHVYDMSNLCCMPLHAGADHMIVEDFLESVSKGTQLKGTDIETAFHSHEVCFAAEDMRMSR